jgi:aquaporin Z
MNYRALVAEFIGTFALILVGCCCIAAYNFIPKVGPGVGLLGIALAHGLTIAVMASATAAISGGHLNPAVTFGLMVGQKISAVTGALYIVAQLLGAYVGALVANYIIPPDRVDTLRGGIPALSELMTPTKGIWIEAVATFFLVFVVYGTAVDKRAPKVGALFIGLTVTLGILFSGPFTGGALNPARWFGPAMALKSFENAPVWTVGPLLGGLVAGLIYAYVLEDKKAPATE